MDFLSFELQFELRAQSNGTLVASCSALPVLAAGHDLDSLADKLVSALQSVIGRLEALGDTEKARHFLSENGIDSTIKTGALAAIGFDEKRLRMELRKWAARQSEPATLQCHIAA